MSDKLLSDEELLNKVNYMLTTLYSDDPAIQLNQLNFRILDLINTQKRLYAAREREEGEVSGQLAAVEHLDGKIFYIETSPSGSFIKRVINKYRDELSQQYEELRRIK